jgi:hypothetical protein
MVEQGAENSCIVHVVIFWVAIEKHPDRRKQRHVVLSCHRSCNCVRGYGYAR